MAKPILQRAAWFKDTPMRKIGMPFVSQLPQHRYCLALLLVPNAHISILGPLRFMPFLRSHLSLTPHLRGPLPLRRAKFH